MRRNIRWRETAAATSAASPSTVQRSEHIGNRFAKIKQRLRRVAPQFEFLISDAEQPIRVVSAKSTIAPKAALRNVSGGLHRERCRRGTRV
jgi:hypothetical protein